MKKNISEIMKNSKNTELRFEDFQDLAVNPTLTKNEKIDFPESYRRGYTKAILTDIIGKLGLTNTSHHVVCDIGCGCGDLALALISWTKKHKHRLLLVDSKEMLHQLPADRHVKTFPGKFPRVPALLKQYKQTCDAVLCYSVIQYVYAHGDIHLFIKKALTLLKPNGVLLLGDIPNEDKRNRFLKTPEGATFSSSSRRTSNKMHDGIVMQIVQRYRKLGFETYLLPQNANLPLANRREDIVMVKRI